MTCVEYVCIALNIGFARWCRVGRLGTDGYVFVPILQKFRQLNKGKQSYYLNIYLLKLYAEVKKRCT